MQIPSENNIVAETNHYFAISVPKGFEVYKIGLTHSTRVAIIGYKGDEGLKRVDKEIARREAIDASPTVQRPHPQRKRK
jgi:hypothetical protein